MNKLLFIPAIAITGSLISAATFADLDSDSATVNMSVGLYASLTGLDDFTLSTTDADGSASAVYSGSDDFQLESNGQVRVNLSGGNLSNGSTSIATSYAMDGSGTTFDTTLGVVHNASHNVSATAILGNISSQQAGAYSGVITLTVSAI